MIYVIIGKSASGKDHIYDALIHDEKLGFDPFVIYTTRPMREGECEGREYHFTDEAGLARMRAEGRVIEERVYNTVNGDWYYFTADNEGIRASETAGTSRSRDRLMIGTIESFVKIRDYYGEEKVCPLYIEADPYLRLIRSAERERTQKEPNYREVCRRYLADEEDFSEEKIAEARIGRRFSNNGAIEDCIEEIARYIYGIKRI